MSTTGFVRLQPDQVALTPGQASRAAALPASFVESIGAYGVLHPILVRRGTAGYELVAGARRVMAARQAGVTEIPAMIVVADDEQAARLSRAENEQREPVGGSATPPAVAALDGASALPGDSVRPAPALGRRPSPWLLAAASLALILAGLWAGFDWGRRSVPVSLAGTQQLSLPQAFGDTGAQDLIPAMSSGGRSSRDAEDSPGATVDPAAFVTLVDRGVTVEAEGAGVRLTFDAPLFTYRASLDASRHELLRAVGGVLAGHSNGWSVVVTGHTDATPLRGQSPYRDNAELGLARASEVARFLWREAGVPAGMVRVASAGDAAPLFPGDDPATQRRNRTATLRIVPASP
jgi:flagellar motor protein MotB